MPNKDTTLLEYALGLLDLDAREAVGQEVGASSVVKAELRAIEEGLSSIALAEELLRPGTQVRDTLPASLEPHTRFEELVERLPTFLDLGAERIRELLRAVGAVSGDPWQDSPLPGVHFFDFDGGQRVALARCGFVYMEPGVVFPKHRHLGDEWSLILQGRAQQGERGLISEPGDRLYMPKGSAHSFRVLDGEPLVFVVVVHEGFELVTE